MKIPTGMKCFASAFFIFCWIGYSAGKAQLLSTDVKKNETQSEKVFCRISNGIYLEPNLFSSYACALCYQYIDDRLFVEGAMFKRFGQYLVDIKNNVTVVANISDAPLTLWDSFATEKAQRLWIKCCEAAVDCCNTIKVSSIPVNISHCPRTWDGWVCWPDTDAGITATSSCPWHVYHHTEPTGCTRSATKICTENGTWYLNPKSKKNPKAEWTNFKSCGGIEDIKDVLNAHIYSFVVSIIFLVPALVVFMVYKQLQVFRIKMHRNLFLSLFLNAIFAIAFEAHFMWDSLTKGSSSMVEANSVLCKVFYTTTKYFRLCTYMWMLCEGFYLNKLIVAAFAEQRSMKLFYAIGWGAPVIPVIIWASLRHVYGDFGCWITPVSGIEWVIFVPMLLALIANLVFLGNIIRVLIYKLTSTKSQEPTQFRRAVKATLVLIPLFGLHFYLLMYHPKIGNCNVLHVYSIVTYCVDGLQGAVVAIIFCYLNHEVLNLIQRSYRRRKLVQSVSSVAGSKKFNSIDSRTSITNTTSLSDYTGSSSSKK